MRGLLREIENQMESGNGMILAKTRVGAGDEFEGIDANVGVRQSGDLITGATINPAKKTAQHKLFFSIIPCSPLRGIM
jgi:hypothetical protein